MSDSWIGHDIKDGIGILTIRRPEVMNAVSPALVAVIERAFKTLTASDSGVRCIVITGEGRAFCAGADLSEDSGNDVPAEQAGSVLQRVYHPFLRQLRDSDIPIITAVNGAAVGAGMSFAMMGDIITCARSAYFLQAFRRIGLVPDCGSTWLLPRQIGGARARELSLLGEKLGAEKALEWGLVNRVFDDEKLMPETLAIARQIADGPLGAQGKIRRLYWETTGNSFEEQLDLEDRFQLVASTGPEFAEGVSAFREKRAADYRKV
ncbi:enoyl-CoA hydratase/isomerase [Mesorhizobium sp. CGMCC 1.15528]|uniref:Enoyl-CoA hydratase/isomerase n=1 Tax=Mesorhizobium zhangyense TaxID=1776730 RepID=A0A7C9VBB7_9HYPH|nr:enoyl-CoA hydratase/isomerase [Mesorhizobium zhangyense]NGN44563.1 enoyl-CoA hydratase/isomerase [Mesorhizobium zhangyense]